MATIVHGQNRTNSPGLNGQSVSAIREDYAALFNIPTDAQASVNGVVVAENYVLLGTDELVFATPVGQKG